MVLTKIEELEEMAEELKKCKGSPNLKISGLKKKCVLEPHQLMAVEWMMLKEKQSQGGILADDMGLGKTLQIIALILKEREEEKKERKEKEEDENLSQSENGSESDFDDRPRLTLIVCPLSLMDQWVNEITKFVSSEHEERLSCYKYHGPNKIADSKTLQSNYCVVITTYATLRRDCSDLKSKSRLFHVNWKRIVLDEAHIVKNPETAGSAAVCALNAKYRWCVTGTPIQNKLLDLYSLYKFLQMPHFATEANWVEEIGQGTDLENQRLLYALLRATMLRRTKKELENVLALPRKTEKPISIVLDKDEQDLYWLIAEYVRPWGRINTNKGYSGILLKRLALAHPNLLITDGKGAINLTDVDDPSVINDKDPEESEESKADADKIRILENKWKYDGTKQSFIEQVLNWRSFDHKILQPCHEPSKLRKLHELLEHEVLCKNDKAIIVSQWTKMLDLIADSLEKRKIKYCVVSGPIKLDERRENCKKFNEPGSEIKVLLLQMNVGGAGLNLIGGNHLFIYDLHWNPQLMKQAFDRVYRMGQTKDVFIYKLITEIENSIEENILTTQEKKLQMFEEVMNFNEWIPGINRGLSDNVMVETMRLRDGEEYDKLLEYCRG
ncbi:transcription termination factor 2 [Frankliniella occidentalis]|uniref:Transcription termination factor 2 n=1 Tax=Frankliniella occidentalis TaxID=133901 RepID=A0A6J1T591_FRAOC|nr:transcription termination factor 2 [Frankliniella occidentalis]